MIRCEAGVFTALQAKLNRGPNVRSGYAAAYGDVVSVHARSLRNLAFSCSSAATP
jgi:hypothetical protein